MARSMAGISSTVIVILASTVVCAQTYPTRPVRIVTSEPGGGTDFGARLIAQGLTSSWSEQVIVDNRTGIIGQELVAKAQPDGYTLLLEGASLWVAPLIQKMPYDPVRDFSPVTLANTQPIILVVHPSLPAGSVKELIALAKAKPGELNYASGGTGGSPHLVGELFKSMAGVNIVRVPYKGAGPALNAVMAGQVQMMFSTGASVAPHLKGGRLKGLAISSPKPSALFPGLPAIAASGLPGFEAASMHGVFVPAKTAAAIINRLNHAIVRVLNTEEVKKKLFEAGAEVVGSSSEEFAVTVKAEMSKWSKLIKDASIKVDN